MIDCISARWVKIDLMQTPEIYARHILWKLNSPVHSVRKMPHLKQPIMVGSSIRYTYKIFDEDVFVSLFDEQKDIPLQMNAAFSNSGILIENDPYDEDDPLEALKAARERGRHSRYSLPAKPKLRSSIVIGEGEGRRTREFEVQWWPNIYKGSFGKLCLRFFVNKIEL